MLPRFFFACVSMTMMVLAGCAAHGSTSGRPAEPMMAEPSPHRATADEKNQAMPAGSSDGETCEEASAANVEEIDMRASGAAPDLSAADFAAVLNKGTYLATCEVPETSRAQVCVAVRNGAPVGVTVALDPANADLERCVSREIRTLTFASHPKLDVVRVKF